MKGERQDDVCKYARKERGKGRPGEVRGRRRSGVAEAWVNEYTRWYIEGEKERRRREKEADGYERHVDGGRTRQKGKGR